MTAAARSGWVLHQAHSDVGSWLRRSAAAHTLFLGLAFSALLLAVVGVGLRDRLPPTASQASWAVLGGMALLAALPLPLLARRHARRSATSIALTPLGLALMTPEGLRAVPFGEVAEVRVRAEPAFASVERPHRRGPMRGLPAFHAVLLLRERGGAQWEFVARRLEEVAGVVAWLDVLGVGDRLRAPPSGLAARRAGEEALRRAEALVALACLAVFGALVALTLPRFAAVHVPGGPWSGAALLALGCALYLASYVFQARAAGAWLEALGLAGGPPVEGSDAAPRELLPWRDSLIGGKEDARAPDGRSGHGRVG